MRLGSAVAPLEVGAAGRRNAFGQTQPSAIVALASVVAGCAFFRDPHRDAAEKKWSP